MSEQYGKNLSEGSVVKQLILFALPFLASNIVQSLYNVADMLIVGNFSGTVSMSGVNIGGQVTFILTNIVIGLCTGGTVLIAQYLGAGERRELDETISTLMSLLLAAAVLITSAMLILKNPVLRLIRTPAESFDEASRYLTVTVLGVVFIFGYNALSAIMRGMGDSRRPLYFVLTACITNIVLDLVLVAKFHMGATGAAVATVISQALSMILCILYLKKHNFSFDFKPSSFRFHKHKLRMIFQLGTPTAVQNGITSFSFLIITTLVNVIGGMYASAAVGVVSKINGFAIMPAVAMSGSVSTVAAQNIGAGKWERARRTCFIGMGIAFAISVVVFGFVRFFAADLMALFDRDAQTIAYGVEYISTFSFDFLIVPVCFSFNGLFIASGHTGFSLLNAMLTSLLLRAPASYLFGAAMGLGILGVGMGAPIASAGGLLLSLWFYASGRWKTNIVATFHQ